MRKGLPRFLRAPVYAACMVGGLATFAAAPAKAQIFNFLFGDGLRANEVERMLEARGLRPVGPIVRNGHVYIADVAVSGGRTQRLIIDAYDGRVLERFRVSSRPNGEISSPRPPIDINAEDHPTSSGWPSFFSLGDSEARSDDASGTSAGVPRPTGDDSQGKAKAKHKKIELTPLAQPSSNSPADGKPASEASSGVPPPADVKVSPAPVATPSVPPPKAPGGKPAINDVPVDPLD